MNSATVSEMKGMYIIAPKAAATAIKASTSVMGACLYCCCGLETMDGQPGAVAAVGGVMAGGAKVWGSGGYFLVFTLPFFPSTRVVAFRLRLVWSKMNASRKRRWR